MTPDRSLSSHTVYKVRHRRLTPDGGGGGGREGETDVCIYIYRVCVPSVLITLLPFLVLLLAALAFA